MITKFKIFEDLENILIEVDNPIKELLDYLIDELSLIFYKRKTNYKALKIKSIKGFFDKTRIEQKNKIIKSELKIELTSIPKILNDTIDANMMCRKNFNGTECIYTIKINNDEVYDFPISDVADYNKKLVEVAVREYKKHLKKEYHIKNA